MKKILYLVFFSFFLFIPETYSLPTNIKQCVESAGGYGCQSGLKTFNVSQNIKFWYFQVEFNDILNKGDMYHFKIEFFGDLKDGFYGYAPDLWWFQQHYTENDEIILTENLTMYNMTWTGDATSHYRTLEFDFIPVTDDNYFTLAIQDNDGCLYWSYSGDSTFGATELEVTQKYGSNEDTNQNTQDIINNNNQNTNNIINNNNQNTDKVIDSLTGNEAPDNLLDLESAVGWLPAGPVDSILNMPISISNRLLEVLSYTGNECSPITIQLPYINENLSIPCFSTISSKIDGLDSFLFSIQSIASAFILYYYLKDLYSWVNSIILLDKNVKKGGV